MGYHSKSNPGLTTERCSLKQTKRQRSIEKHCGPNVWENRKKLMRHSSANRGKGTLHHRAYSTACWLRIRATWPKTQQELDKLCGCHITQRLTRKAKKSLVIEYTKSIVTGENPYVILGYRCRVVRIVREVGTVIPNTRTAIQVLAADFQQRFGCYPDVTMWLDGEVTSIHNDMGNYSKALIHKIVR